MSDRGRKIKDFYYGFTRSCGIKKVKEICSWEQAIMYVAIGESYHTVPLPCINPHAATKGKFFLLLKASQTCVADA
jgi:hypothetical protein